MRAATSVLIHGSNRQSTIDFCLLFICEVLLTLLDGSTWIQRSDELINECCLLGDHLLYWWWNISVHQQGHSNDISAVFRFDSRKHCHSISSYATRPGEAHTPTIYICCLDTFPSTSITVASQTCFICTKRSRPHRGLSQDYTVRWQKEFDGSLHKEAQTLHILGFCMGNR